MHDTKTLEILNTFWFQLELENMMHTFMKLASMAKKLIYKITKQIKEKIIGIP